MKDSIKTLERAYRRFTVLLAISLNLDWKLSKRTLCQFFVSFISR